MMKMIDRHIIISGSLCLLCLCACQRDQLGFLAGGNDDVINVNINGNGYTRCADDADSEGVLLGTKMIVTEDDDTLFLSVYLSDMEDFTGHEEHSENTKGAPVYYNNSNSSLCSIYGKVFTSVYDKTGSAYVSTDRDGNTALMEDVEVIYSNSKWQLDSIYYWPKKSEDLFFCTIAPSDSLITDRTWDASNKRYSFRYRMPAPELGDSPRDAENQKDIVVGVNKNNRDSSITASIDLKHALTAVRFVKGKQMPVTLTSVCLNNLYSTGKATVTLADDGTTSVSWSDQSNKASYSQTYNVDAWKEADGLENNPLDTSSVQVKTFMIIPQQISDDAELSIYLGNALHPETMTLKSLGTTYTSLADWSNFAGKVITFKLSCDTKLVSVKVTDKCQNNKKSDIKIVNDGTEDIFVRAELVGNWVNQAGEILASWTEEDSYGYFDGDATKTKLSQVINSTYWYKAADGFYYYKYYIAPGDTLKHNLFQSFAVTSKPHDSQGQWEGDVNMEIAFLEVNVLVQAVKAETSKTAVAMAWGSSNVTSLSTDKDL